MKRALFIFMCIFISSGMFSQPMERGQVVVHQPSRLDTLVNTYISLREAMMDNNDHKAIPGYRIQIFFDSGINSSDRAKEARNEFEKTYTDIPAYITWKAPNYRVRVGDFRTRLDAEKFLNELLRKYPNAWVIKDEINFPNLN